MCMYVWVYTYIYVCVYLSIYQSVSTYYLLHLSVDLFQVQYQKPKLVLGLYEVGLVTVSILILQFQKFKIKFYLFLMAHCNHCPFKGKTIKRAVILCLLYSYEDTIYIGLGLTQHRFWGDTIQLMIASFRALQLVAYPVKIVMFFW